MSASNCMHTLLALRSSEQDNMQATVAMNTVLGQAALNQMDPFLSQNADFGGQNRSVSNQGAFVSELSKPIMPDRVAQVDSDSRLTCDGGHQAMQVDRDCDTARQKQTMQA